MNKQRALEKTRVKIFNFLQRHMIFFLQWKCRYYEINSSILSGNWWKCSTSEKICPCINMQTDVIACLIVFYGGTEMSLTVTFLEGTTLLLQNISVCLIWPSLYVLHAARLFWHVLGEPQGTEPWVAAICPGDFTTLTTPHVRGPCNQPVIWFPFRWICSVSSMIVSLAPVKQIADPWGLIVIALQAWSSCLAVIFGTPPCLHLDLHCFPDLLKPLNHLKYQNIAIVAHYVIIQSLRYRV